MFLEVKPERPDWDSLDVYRGEIVNIWLKGCGGWRSQEENYGCSDEEEVKFVGLREEG